MDKTLAKTPCLLILLDLSFPIELLELESEEKLLIMMFLLTSQQKSYCFFFQITLVYIFLKVVDFMVVLSSYFT